METTLITGANRGIGLEFSRQLAEDGWCVLACSRDLEKSDALNKLAAEYPERITLYALDVTDHRQIEKLSQILANKPIDLLINNAGVFPDINDRSFGQTDYDSWADAFLVNTMAPLKMAEEFIAQITQSSRKTIVTITSKMGSVADNGSGGSYIYRSSKSAVNMVIKSIAIDLESNDIISVLLHPGWVRTDMGGPSGLISVEQSVSGMLSVIREVTSADSGKFIAYDGQIIPW
ncbi:MAG: SDR family oxidoreductase [Nitrosomonadaceae bacterium]|nr:SDR family oxidoreductase [Nitrosomonadaceae bacterium]